MSTIDFKVEENTMTSLEEARFGIVVSDWYQEEVTGNLLKGAYDALVDAGIKKENIEVKHVPGSFELVFGCSEMVNWGDVDAVVALGCIIKGGTPHFDYVCMGVANGLAQLNVDSQIPTIFGVLTTDDLEQAKDRSGGKLGNKGAECAVAAIKMVETFGD